MDNSVLKELLLEESLCDAVIKVGDGEFKAHRIILCGCSSYFSELFCSNPTQKVFSFPDVSSKVMSLIVENAYTGSVTVTEDNVLDLLAGAQRFDVNSIIQACCDFLQKNLSSDSSIVAWRLAEHSQYPELREKACLYILLHFQEIARFSQEFVQLSVEELTYFIEKDELNVKQESAVFEAILRWIGFAPEERRDHLTTLLPSVRLLLMPIEYLVEIVSKDDTVRNNLDCVNMVTSTVEILRDPSMERPPTRTRLPAELLFTISGFHDGRPNDKIELHNVRTDRWLTVYQNDQPFPRYCGCVHLQGSIYFIGGSDTHYYLSSVQKFTLATQRWQEVGSLHEPRCFIGVAVLNGFIYAMGGMNRSRRLKSAERFQPNTNQWTEIAPMHHWRADAGAAALHGKIYICGGLSGGEPLFSAECYNPDTDQWTLITPMETARYGAGVVSYNGHIYVAGGEDGTNNVSTVSAYDPVSKHRRTAAPMLYTRSCFGIAVLEEQLYVVGGFQNEDSLVCSKVERYDGAGDSWQAVRDLDHICVFVSCCVVEREPHAVAYLS
ncbi:kelch-like protein 10 [Cololabis saira]|uniref:kelch-like protein 10 n=1 Tax=Cololabis saira TaxID=129043 RepID=UPI002AD38069|nr:kelch-like protein 10 [Cololabis saira]